MLMVYNVRSQYKERKEDETMDKVGKRECY